MWRNSENIISLEKSEEKPSFLANAILPTLIPTLRLAHFWKQ